MKDLQLQLSGGFRKFSLKIPKPAGEMYADAIGYFDRKVAIVNYLINDTVAEEIIVSNSLLPKMLSDNVENEIVISSDGLKANNIILNNESSNVVVSDTNIQEINY